jgi:hypothetical protein
MFKLLLKRSGGVIYYSAGELWYDIWARIGDA